MTDEDQRLRDLVRRFQQACQNGDAVDLDQFLPPPDDPLRAQALHALIEIDLEACWRQGRRVRLDAYLQRFPELGTARTIPAVVIVAEYRARTLHGDKPSLEVYQRRFPDQFAECQRLAREAGLLQPTTPGKPAGEGAHLPPPSGPSFVPLSGGYKLLQRIGSGGFAEVWRAEAPGGFPAAVKIIFRPLDHDEAQRELKALEVVRLFSHPYLLQTQAAWAQDGRLYVAMELAEASLRDRLKQCRRAALSGIPADELLRYLSEAAEALDYLHAEKVQHRDIKPDNILLLRGHAKVADFGLARLQEKAVIQTVTGSGTPAYMPPEAWGGKLHPNSDQYSLAVTYAELRLDRRPFAGSSPAEIMMAHIEATPDLAPLSEAEQRVVLRALAPEPSERYGSCVEFVRALAGAASGHLEPPRTRLSVAAVPRSVKAPASRPETGLSGAPTDEASSVGAPAWRQGRRAPVSDSNLRQTPVMTPPSTGWRGQRPQRTLPVVLLLFLGIPVLGVLAVLAGKFFPPLTPRPPALPPNFQKAPGAAIAIDGGKKYYDRIERVFPDGTRVPFVFVRREELGQPGGADIPPFYIMVDKVSVDLFSRFAKEGRTPLNNNAWQKLPWTGKYPVFGVDPLDAYNCANWLGGNLPSKREWDKAAGLYQFPPGDPALLDRGPFKGRWDPNNRPRIAVSRQEPMEAGQAEDDVSWCGCRDMAGNGRELTRNLLTREEELPLTGTPRKNERVIVRGHRYTDDGPVLFRELELNEGLDSVEYKVPDEETGFRVVLDEFGP